MKTDGFIIGSSLHTLPPSLSPSLPPSLPPSLRPPSHPIPNVAPHIVLISFFNSSLYIAKDEES